MNLYVCIYINMNCFFSLQLRTPLNLVLVNLAVSDLGISGIGSTFSLAAAIENGWPFSHVACVAYAFSMSLFGKFSLQS